MSAFSVTVGIDVAKAHVDVCVLGADSGAQRFFNDPDGHSALAASLLPLGLSWWSWRLPVAMRLPWPVRCKPRACLWPC
jgi:hypothetical protein